MNRRSFLKICGLLPFGAGLAVVGDSGASEGQRRPSKRDVVFAPLWEMADHATMSAPFVQHEDIWFFADQDVIKYCPKSDLRWDNWNTIVLEGNDYFDFWLLDEGNLYWCGKHNKWEIVETKPVKIQYQGYWTGERWTG